MLRDIQTVESPLVKSQKGSLNDLQQLYKGRSCDIMN